MAKKQLHPGAKWSFRIGGYIMFAIPLYLLSVVASLSIFALAPKSPMIYFFSLPVLLILLLVFGEIFSRMSYNRWFYELGPKNMRLERGIIWKTYSNVPYERVQNVDITRGIIARMFGFSTVNVQTAGYSGGGKYGSGGEGVLPAVGVKDAEKIREFIMKKVGHRSGL